MRYALALFLFLHPIFSYDLDPLFLIDSCIDVRTGEWIEQTERATYRGLENKWHFFPHTQLTLFGPDYKMVQVREKTGLQLTYHFEEDNRYKLQIPPSVTNTALGQLGARTNLQNQILIRADKFTFTLETPEKTKRIYQKSHHEGSNLYFLLQEERFADGTFCRYRYDRNHMLYAINGSKVDLPEFEELPSGRISERKGTTFTYESDKTIVHRKDGTKTLYHFTKDKRLTCIEKRGSLGELIEKTPYVFSDQGLLIQKGNQTYFYDDRGNPIKEKTEKWEVLRTFDTEDRVSLAIEEKHGKTLKTHYSYSKNGMLEEVKIDDGKHLRQITIEGDPDFPTTLIEKTDNLLLKTSRYTYGQGRVHETIFDPNGIECSSKKIALSEIHKPWLDLYPIGMSIENGYQVERDTLGRVISMQKGDRHQKWTYKDFHLLSQVDVMGHTTSFSYNTSGQKIGETLFTPRGSITTSFEYDAKGRVDKKTCGEIVTCFEYDEKDHIIETREETLDGVLLTKNAPAQKPKPSLDIPLKKGTLIQTDPFGNIIDVQTEDGTIHYSITYNKRDQPTSVTDHITGQKGFRKYDPLGNLMEETLLNGYTLKCQRDLYGRRTSLTFPDQSKIQMQWGPKFLEKIHRVSHRSKYDYVHLFTKYNHLGFPVKQRQIADLGDIAYDLDADANIIGVESRFLDQRLENLQTFKIRGVTIPYSYQTDSLGRIVEILQPEKTITYTYDVWNRRMTKVIIQKDQKSPTDLAYLYDDTREIGAMSRYYHRLVELRVTPEIPINSGDGSIAYELGGFLYLPQFDLSGNPASLISVTQNKLIESYLFSPTGTHRVFDAFGDPLHSSSACNPWGFQGYRQDPETGLYYISGRYYDPNLHIFVTDKDTQ